MSLVTDIDSRGVARVTLNRPEVHNAFDAAMIEALRHAFTDLGRNASVRLVMLEGAGRNFCAGADLQSMRTAATQALPDNQHDAYEMGRMFAAVNACPKPVIAHVRGQALGGGVGLVACCDVVVANANARFGLTEVRLGLIPAVISPFVMAKIGESQARRYMLTAERFDAQDALRIGLIHQISDDDGAVDTLIETLLMGAPEALSEGKALISSVARQPIDEEVLRMTAASIARRRATDEAREGIKAFFDKRKPDWQR